MGFFLLCVIAAVICFILFAKIDNYCIETLAFAFGFVAVVIAIVLFGMMVGTAMGNKAFHDSTMQERIDYIAVLESDDWYNKDDAMALIIDIQEWNSSLVARNENVHNFMIKGLVNDTSDVEVIDLSKYLPIAE